MVILRTLLQDTGTINLSISGAILLSAEAHSTPPISLGELTPKRIIRLKFNHIRRPRIQRYSQRTRSWGTTGRQERDNMAHAIDQHIRIPLCAISVDIMDPNCRCRRDGT
jgi:hypothetical protein